MAAKYPPGRPFARRVSCVFVHHSATPDGEALSWGAIRKFHTETNGWDAIAYHAGAELVRDGFEVLIGRPEDRTGAHVAGRDSDGVPWNSKSLGFCFVGDFDKTEPPRELLEVAARRWFVPVLRRHNLRPEDILPHNFATASKSCPGVLFDVELFRAIVRGYL